MSDTVEAVAAIIFEAMRFEREGKTPMWVGGNSHAENEARAKARAAIAAARPHILEEAREIADKATGGLRPVSDEWSREQLEYWTCGVIDAAAFVDAAIRAAKEAGE